MRSIFTSVISILSLVSTAFFYAGSAKAADVFPESWESGTFSSLGWKMTTSGQAMCDWGIVSYADETSQFPNLLSVPSDCGTRVLKGRTRGISSGTTRPDNRLVSPAFTVPSPGWLSFMLASNMAANGSANVTGDSRAMLEVYVSPTGNDADEAFTDTLYSETPIGLNKWKAVNIDLTRYAGKEIRLALRLYCKAQVLKNMVLNQLYIDRMQFADAPAADIELVGIEGLSDGTERNQTIKATVRNNAAKVSSFTVTATPSRGQAVTEIVNEGLEQGETYTYTFTRPVTITSPGMNKITVDVAADGDVFLSNNSLSREVYIYPSSTLPFELSEDAEEASQQFVSTASGSVRVPDGWTWMSNHNAWIHTLNSKIAYLHTSVAYKLTGDPLKIEIGGDITGNDAEIGFYATKHISDFGEPLARLRLTKGAPEGVMIVPPVASGEYILAFRILSGKTGEQVALRKCKISKTSTLPDMSVESVAPAATVAGEAARISAVVRNVGAADALNVKISYTCGSTVVSETIDTVAPAQVITHVFATPLNLQAGEHPLTVSVEAAGDFASSNDTLTDTIVAYSSRSLPWRDSFEDEAETKLWTTLATQGSGLIWKAIGGYEFDGTHLLSILSSTTPHSAWAISPAINIPSGYAGRLSFYYGGGGSAGHARIRAYLTRSTDPDEILAKGQLLADVPTENTGVSYSSTLLAPVEEGGNYYVAFYACEGGQSILIDDVRLDATEEIALTGTAVSTTGTGYSLEPGKISIKGINAGRTSLSGVKVAYAAYRTSDGNQERVAYVEEDISSAIAPGEFSHEFKTPLKFEKEGMYAVQAAVVCSEDADAKNNVFTASGPEILKTMHLPALWDMERGDNLHGFIFETFRDEDTWKLGAVNQYAGSVGLVHTSSVRNSPAGDMAILNRVYLPAGSYQLSFFYKTTQGQSGDAYKHTFEILMGERPERSALTRSLFKAVNVTSPAKRHTKVMREFTVDKDGYYWLGVNCTQGGMMSNLTIDNILIESPQAAYNLTAVGDAYASDFSTEADKWQRYDPIKLNSQQWDLLTPENGAPYFELKEFTALDVFYDGSWLQAPSFKMSAGLKYEVEIDADIEALDQDNPLKGSECIRLYQSARDLPDEFTEVGAFDKSGKLQFTPAADGLRYLTLKAHSEGAGTFRLRKFSIRATENAGVRDTDISDRFWHLNGNILEPAAGTTVRVYTLSGILVSQTSGAITLEPGVYVIKSSDGTVVKITI